MNGESEFLVFGSLFLIFTGNRESGINKMITFQSKYYDSESGLYYYYHRYYDPLRGRFITEDPIGIAGGLNLYRFVNNNPVNFVDPWGLINKKYYPGTDEYANELARLITRNVGPMIQTEDAFCKWINCMAGFNVTCCRKKQGIRGYSPMGSYAGGEISHVLFKTSMNYLLKNSSNLRESSKIAVHLLSEETVIRVLKFSSKIGKFSMIGLALACAFLSVL